MARILIAAPWLWLGIIVALSNRCHSFAPLINQRQRVSRYDHKLYCTNYQEEYYERRSFLTKSASLIGLATATPANAIDAVEETGNFDCLLDLPPITPGCVRLYLCRHGQTENNRLGKAQGARLDPPINRNGYEQAQRLGMTLSRLESSSASRRGGGVPTLAVHSKLRRTRETAEVLASTYNTSQSARSNKKSALGVYGQPIESLGEIDFGSLDGIEVKKFRQAIRYTFASWSLGNIDKRTGGGGESGREVLERAAQSLDELSTMAMNSSSSSTSSILAVSHSAYLRVLLALVGDIPLAETVLWKIQNGSVNVVDVNVEGKRRLVTSNSGLFGGEIVGRLRESNGLELDLPEVHLIRRNEVRHLEGMDV